MSDDRTEQVPLAVAAASIAAEVVVILFAIGVAAFWCLHFGGRI